MSMGFGVRGQFQSTLLREERHEFWYINQAKMSISIHAPTRGATRPTGVLETTDVFQSTLLREERLRKPPGLMYLTDFNPRSYERSDNYIFAARVIGHLISIHAPTRGATISDNLRFYRIQNFNPRSYERSDIIYPTI